MQRQITAHSIVSPFIGHPAAHRVITPALAMWRASHRAAISFQKRLSRSHTETKASSTMLTDCGRRRCVSATCAAA